MTTKTKESALWKWLKAGAERFPAGEMHIHRVENAVETGCPDVEGCLRGQTFWTELKTVAKPTGAAGIKVAITDHQINWLRQRWRAGGNAWLLVRIGNGPTVCHYLVPGENLLDLKKTVPEQWFISRAIIPWGSTALLLFEAMASTPRTTSPEQRAFQ